MEKKVVIHGKKFKLVEKIGCVGCNFDGGDVCNLPDGVLVECLGIPTTIYVEDDTTEENT